MIYLCLFEGEGHSIVSRVAVVPPLGYTYSTHLVARVPRNAASVSKNVGYIIIL